ncbi:MAG: 16S rRNA (cytidine(1402)-2'-O)-methyltransferase [Bacillota bacterium]|nr:16S rRNA (cytidine(1402)-2'-O)-methyltransferase [Bacillota bacterium]
MDRQTGRGFGIAPDNDDSADVAENELKSAMQPGVLYIVGTPIGNLGDLSPRAAAILAEADWIAAEDTRRTMKLLNHLSLKKRLISYHQHNQRQREASLLAILRNGQRLALVSDAGMPGISDPGAEIVAACLAEGIEVTVIPGPSAAFVALAASGLATDRFAFEGFIPSSGKARKESIREIVAEKRTVILYEAPHRLIKTLEELRQAGMSDRKLTIARELTKRFESYYRTTVAAVCAQPDQIEMRGEFALVLEGMDAYNRRCPAAPVQLTEDQDAGQMKDLLTQGLSIKDAVRKLAISSGRSRNDLYALALQLTEELQDLTGTDQTGEPSTEEP